MSSLPAPLLRPLSIADFLDVAIRLYRQNFSVFLGIVAIVYAPLLVTQMAAGYLMGGLMEGAVGGSTPAAPNWQQMLSLGGAYLGLMALYALVVPLGQGALAVAVSRRYLNQPVSVADAYRTVGTRWLRILLALLLVGVALLLATSIIAGGAIGIIMLLAHKTTTVVAVLAGVAIGLLALALLAGVAYVALLCDFTTPAIVIEDIGVLEAIARSISLVRGYWWHCFGVLFLMSLLVGLISAAISYPVSMLAAAFLMEKQAALAQALTQGVSVSVRMLVEPVLITGFVLLYYDLRVRKEGFDLELLARAMGYAPPAAPGVPLPPKVEATGVPLPPVVTTAALYPPPPAGQEAADTPLAPPAPAPWPPPAADTAAAAPQPPEPNPWAIAAPEPSPPPPTGGAADDQTELPQP